MKKNNYINGGFTLIEVLISLVILSIITVITASFLQSSIQSKEIVFSQSAQILRINLLADSLREDIANANNTPLTDTRGEAQQNAFQSSLNTDSFKFITKAKSGESFSSSLVQVEYLLDNDRFIRKQFYAAAPANQESFMETTLLKNIKKMNLEFSDGKAWFYFWPANNLSQQRFPALIKVQLEQDDGNSYTWIMHSNLENIYE